MPEDYGPPSTCPNVECAGTGYINGELCPTCYGTGAVPVKGARALILRELAAHKAFDDASVPSGCVRSYQVVEAVHIPEYNTLTDAQKLDFLTVVSAGVVNLNVGANGRNVLAELFGAGTTTRANILALLD